MPGYTGKQCLNEIDECASLPCFQGATCVDRINSFECICPQTFSGRLCETGTYKIKTLKNTLKKKQMKK